MFILIESDKMKTMKEKSDKNEEFLKTKIIHMVEIRM